MNFFVCDIQIYNVFLILQLYNMLIFIKKITPKTQSTVFQVLILKKLLFFKIKFLILLLKKIFL